MLKKIFCISLAVSVCLLIAGSILLPIAAKQTVEIGLGLFSDYYREGSAVNSLPIEENTKVIIQADNMEVNLMRSNNDKLWVRYNAFGTNNAQATFTKDTDQNIQMQVTYQEPDLKEGNKIKALLDISQYRGHVNVYIPEGMEYEVTGMPYRLDEWDMEDHAQIDGIYIGTTPPSENQEILTGEEAEIQGGYAGLKENIFRLMQDYPYEYTIQHKENEVRFQMEKTDFIIEGDLSFVSIGDGFIEIDQESITINGEYFYIPDDNIQIKKDSVRIGKYIFTA